MRHANDSVDEDAPTREFKPQANRISVRGPVTDSDRLWNVSDVARYLGVSKSWVYHRAEAGLLPYRRVGGLLRFEPARIRDLR